MTKERAWCAVAVVATSWFAVGCAAATSKGSAAKPQQAPTEPTKQATIEQATRLPAPRLDVDPSALPSEVREWCNTKGFGRFELVCYDARDGKGVSVVAVPPATLVPANVGVVVRVRHRTEDQWTISIEGEAGARIAGRAPPSGHMPSILTTAFDNSLYALVIKPSLEVPVDPVGTFVLSPRAKPGPAKLTLAADADRRVEQTLVFTEKFSSAVRVGIGLAFGDAVRPEYSTRVPPGSETQVIEVSNSGDAALELVVGVAPFVLDRFLYGGRSYDDPTQDRNPRIAPYIGFGALSADPSGIDALKSLHAGIEVELSPGVSVAGTAVVRRVKVLRDGMQPGSPTMNGDIPLTDTFGVGAALILNVTPDVFRFTAEAQ